MSYISGSRFVELPYTVGSGSLELPYISGSWSGSVELPFISGFKSVELPYISGSGFMDSNIIRPGSLNFRILVDPDPGSKNVVFLTHWLLQKKKKKSGKEKIKKTKSHYEEILEVIRWKIHEFIFHPRVEGEGTD